jgi:oligosaccharide repeat unit polymerase
LLGAREAFLIGFISWLGGNWSVTRARTHKHRTFLNFATLSSLVLTAGFLVFLFFFVFAVRDAVHGDDLHLQADKGRAYDYMLGPPLAFASWAEHDESDIHRWGGLTFSGAFDFLGFRRRVIGTYADYVNTIGSEDTNIFTMFRGLIEDFTLPGAAIVCGLFGYWSGRIYSKPSWDLRFILGLSAHYAVALFSPLVSFFSSNSAVFSWLVAAIVLSSLQPRTILKTHSVLQTSE